MSNDFFSSEWSRISVILLFKYLAPATYPWTSTSFKLFFQSRKRKLGVLNRNYNLHCQIKLNDRISQKPKMRLTLISITSLVAMAMANPLPSPKDLGCCVEANRLTPRCVGYIAVSIFSPGVWTISDHVRLAWIFIRENVVDSERSVASDSYISLL